MSKESVFTMKLESELREFVRNQREVPELEAFVARKVEAGRRDVRVGEGRPHDEVEADFGARRKQLLQRSVKADA